MKISVFEKQILEVIKKNAQGIEKAVGAKEICKIIKWDIKSERDVRGAVNALRKGGYLIGSVNTPGYPRGFYIPKTKKEAIIGTSLIFKNMVEQQRVFKAMKKSIEKRYSKQLTFKNFEEVS